MPPKVAKSLIDFIQKLKYEKFSIHWETLIGHGVLAKAIAP